MDVRGQVDFLWQFFVTVHIALFALLFIYDHAVEGLNAIAKFFAVIGVAAFEWINGNALINAYLLLDAMQEQYRWSFGQIDRFHPAFYEAYDYRSPFPSNYKEQWDVCNLYPLLIHLLLFGSSYLPQIEDILNQFS